MSVKSGLGASDLFAHHVTAGKLPSVAWVYAEVFITWDDWGGWFDHVVSNQSIRG